MSEPTKLGILLSGGEPRDAVHVAVAPVIADERLVPGTHVGFTRDGDTEHVGVRSKALIGVVDPFLSGFVNVGERFWLFIYPGNITSLRHEWTHPAFVPPPPTASQQWLMEFAREVRLSYDGLMEALKHYTETGEDYCFGYDTPDVVYREPALMWTHYEVVTGTRILNKGDVPFRCAC